MTATTGSQHLPAGTASAGPYALEVTPESADWGHSSLRVLALSAGNSHTLDTGPDEVVVVPLSGGLEVECAGQTLTLTGRRDVFTGPTDFAYLPMGTTATLSSAGGGRFARCSLSLEDRRRSRAEENVMAAAELTEDGRARVLADGHEIPLLALGV